MLTADERAALVERLRRSAADMREHWTRWPALLTEPCRDADYLDVAADELSRPRPVLAWDTPDGDYVEAYIGNVLFWGGFVWDAEKHVPEWRAAGFDVAEVPRG
jgi:hypothetical protein